MNPKEMVDPDKVMKDAVMYLRGKSTGSETGTIRCQNCSIWFFWNDEDTNPRHCNKCVKEIGE